MPQRFKFSAMIRDDYTCPSQKHDIKKSLAFEKFSPKSRQSGSQNSNISAKPRNIFILIFLYRMSRVMDSSLGLACALTL